MIDYVMSSARNTRRIAAGINDSAEENPAEEKSLNNG